MSEVPPVSILILTLNEEKKLPACLAAVARFDDIVVLAVLNVTSPTKGLGNRGRPVHGNRHSGRGKRKGVELKWQDIVNGDPAITAALQASLQALR